MGEGRNKKIIEPSWYIYHLSNIEKRNERAVWELLVPIIGPFIISIVITMIIDVYIPVIFQTPIFLSLLIILVPILYYVTRKTVEMDIDIDRYSWVSYYCGKLGLECYRIGNMPDFTDNLGLYNFGLCRWLRFISWDYRGDKSGKRKLIKKLKRDLKNLPEYIEENKNDSEKMFSLADKFFSLGEYISKENPETRIKTKLLNDLLEHIPERKPGFYDIIIKFAKGKHSIVLSFLFIALIVSILSYYIMGFPLDESITYFVLTISVLYSLYSILTKG